ncbi:MAG: MFS transporter [Planctomycetaceae bacterium]|nr:MFS transporter [bacterium]MDB4786530.1 MFS transporter [Planctomycetaceae bacterium]MDC0273690.1 MFS transporter [Planctomycetaceae bacterium]MDG2388205.1 MFS transporter [Planctomycetaceae bacterium]
MSYTQLTMSPATIQFARSFGATGLHVGILGALPTLMLFMQFVSALLVNHLNYRRRVWFWVSLLQRIIFLPLVAAILLIPNVTDQTWMWWLIAITAVNHALLHFTTPMWMSWMGDYLPHKGLNQYWGTRHLWMQWAGAVSLLAGAVCLSYGGFKIRQGFTILICCGAIFGVADILIFLKVEEPPVTRVPEPKLGKVLTAPFRNRQFRSFILYTCFWHFAAMVGAPFISFYLLDVIGMNVLQLMLLWTCSWVGGAIFAQRLGHLAERYGNRPILIFCTAFKSLNMIGLLLIPRDPNLAFWVMVPVFVIDAILNSGIAIANNGFMIKNSPSENRTMFIAAGTGVAGVVGGITSIVTGLILLQTSGWSLQIGNMAMDNFQVVFLVSLILRLIAAVLARMVREPESHATYKIVVQLIGVTPFRVLRFPVGLYRNYVSSDATVLVETAPSELDSTKETTSTKFE